MRLKDKSCDRLLVVPMAWARPEARLFAAEGAKGSLSPTSWSTKPKIVAADIRAGGEVAMGREDRRNQ